MLSTPSSRRRRANARRRLFGVERKPPMTMMRLVLFALVTLAMMFAQATFTSGEPTKLKPGLGSDDLRETVDIDALPWSSLVRVKTDAGSLCTGTLLTSRMILTAAHCMLSPDTGEMIDAESVQITIGYEHGISRARARGISSLVAPGFQAEEPSPPSADWAMIVLDQPVPGEPLPLAPSRIRLGDPVMLGGWQKDRPHALLADKACRIEAVFTDETSGLLIQHSCSGTSGISGAPLLIRNGEGWAIAGMATMAYEDERGGTAIAATTLIRHIEAITRASNAGTAAAQRGR